MLSLNNILIFFFNIKKIYKQKIKNKINYLKKLRPNNNGTR